MDDEVTIKLKRVGQRVDMTVVGTDGTQVDITDVRVGLIARMTELIDIEIDLPDPQVWSALGDALRGLMRPVSGVLRRFE